MNATFYRPDWLSPDLYPFASRFARLEAGTMHYLDEGRGDPLLFVHGTPTWSFLFRDLIRPLANTHRCVAPDHLGFGLSEQPPGFAGRPQDHAANLSEFIERLDLRDITLVVHDFGGPIGLGAALRHPGRIKRIVLFNTWLWATRDNKQVRQIDRMVGGRLGKLLYLTFNISPRYLLKKGFADPANLPDPVHRHYLKPFPDKASRRPLLQLARALAGSSDWYAEQWEQLEALADKDWLILWGEKDPFLTTEFLNTWRERLPKARARSFDCGHFVPEEATEAALGEIRAFME